LKTPSIDEEDCIKAPNMKNGGLKKHECLKLETQPNTNQKEMENDHRNDPNRTQRAWWRPSPNGVQINPKNGVQKNGPPFLEFGSMANMGF
jgi:hypothetical protein